MAYKDPQDERAKEARRKHYQANKEAYIARTRALQEEMTKWAIQQKDKPCADCGEEYPQWVMEFDHREGEEKVGNISRMVKNGSWNKLKTEVAKCDVVCANCHRMRTAERGGWIQTIFLTLLD